MNSQKLTTIGLIVVILAFSYQTYALMQLEQTLAQVQINLGTSSAVNFTDDGSAPDMVGGC